MTEREKVIKGLELCTFDGTIENCIKEGCPYLGGNGVGYCIDNLMRDALALLKAQEPRVMTIGDLYGYDMGYYERKDEEVVWPVLIARGGPDSDGTVGLVCKDAFEIMADCGLINQTWRIWTAYPTIDQREAAKWE